LAAYVIRRLIWTPVLLLIVSFIKFALVQFAPNMGLNDPIVVQYAKYISNAVRGDFGESIRWQGRTVNELIFKRVPVSAQLSLAALLISVGLGIPIGLFAAVRQGSVWDTIAVSITLVGQSFPVFLTVPVVLWLFALKLGILPTHGWGGFFDTRIILPALVLGIPGIAIITRLTRASTLDVISQDYIRTARSKGLSERIILYRHILRNSIIPVVTTLGFALAGLASGSFIVEFWFGIPGVGLLALEALFNLDYPIIMALTILGTSLFVIANLVVDLAYPFLDPRIRLGGGYIA
jgi:ABC-type dipeptide/oligopeptide/nickel transport system permease component